MRGLLFLALVSLTACGGGGATPGAAPMARAVAGGGTCPDADPVRDGPLVDAIRTRDRAALERAAASGEPRAVAALALLRGQAADRDQAACFAPYLDG